MSKNERGRRATAAAADARKRKRSGLGGGGHATRPACAPAQSGQALRHPGMRPDGAGARQRGRPAGRPRGRPSRSFGGGGRRRRRPLSPPRRRRPRPHGGGASDARRHLALRAWMSVRPAGSGRARLAHSRRACPPGRARLSPDRPTACAFFSLSLREGTRPARRGGWEKSPCRATRPSSGAHTGASPGGLTSRKSCPRTPRARVRERRPLLHRRRPARRPRISSPSLRPAGGRTLGHASRGTERRGSPSTHAARIPGNAPRRHPW